MKKSDQETREPVREGTRTANAAPAPARALSNAEQWARARKEKDLEEKMTALAVIEQQFPEMQKLRPLLSENITEFRAQYPVVLIDCVARSLGIPRQGVDILGGKPYINTTGLNAKVQKDPRRVKTMKAVPILYPFKINPLNQATDPDFKQFFIGSSEDGTAVAAGIVEFEDGSRFVDQGTANAKYLNKEWNKMSTMIPYVMELACTRALNRAMRRATGVGLVSVEELNERGITLIQDKIQTETQGSGRKLELIKTITESFDRMKYNEARRIMYCSKWGGNADLAQCTEEALGKMALGLASEIAVNKPSIPKRNAKKRRAKKKTTAKKAAPKKGKTKKATVKKTA